jgi:hypothetical protein
MTPAEFWASVRPSGKTAEQELVELWERMRNCVRPADRNTTTFAAAGGAATPGGPGSQISMSEWLRRFQPGPSPVEVAVDDAIAKRKARRKREEELLLLLS